MKNTGLVQCRGTYWTLLIGGGLAALAPFAVPQANADTIPVARQLGVVFHVDFAALVGHRFVGDSEVNFVRFVMADDDSLLLDISDELFGVAVWPDPVPTMDMAALETKVFDVTIDPAAFPTFWSALNAGEVALSARFTDTHDAMFAIDYVGLTVETEEGVVEGGEWQYGHPGPWPDQTPNDGYGIDLPDNEPLPGPLSEGVLGATGTGFDEVISSKELYTEIPAIPEPAAFMLLAMLGGLSLVARRGRGGASVGMALLLVCLLPAGVAFGEDVLPGSDLFLSPAPPDGTPGPSHDDFADRPIPADFFGPGSDPFDGVIHLKGAPWEIEGPDPTDPVLIDTIVVRKETAVLPVLGSSDMVATEIVALRLVSTAPVAITFDDGGDTSLYDVEVCLSTVNPQAEGWMEIRFNADQGGRFDSYTPVVYKATFNKVEGVRGVDQAVLDPECDPNDPSYPANCQLALELLVEGGCWAYTNAGFDLDTTVGGLADPDCDGVTAHCVGGNHDGEPCDDPNDCIEGGGECVPDAPFPPSTPQPYGFYIGVCWPVTAPDEDDNYCWSLPPEEPQPRQVLTPEEAWLVAHKIIPPQPPEPDYDEDGVPDPVDNCPWTYNPTQADRNDNFIGDDCEPDQLHIIGPTPNCLPTGGGETHKIKAHVLRDFEPVLVDNLMVDFEWIWGTATVEFVNLGDIAEDKLSTAVVVEDGYAEAEFITTDSVGVALIEMSVRCTNLKTYLLLYVVNPTADDCADAQPVAPGDTVYGCTTAATADDTPACGWLPEGPTAPGVWYAVVGTGDQITASLCNDQTDFDTRLSVYTGGCGGLSCLDGSDDGDCDGDPLLSTVTWCSVEGTEYLILVHGTAQEEDEGPPYVPASEDTGHFRLDILDAGPCERGACYLGHGGCVVTTEPACAALHGLYASDDTACPVKLMPMAEPVAGPIKERRPR